MKFALKMLIKTPQNNLRIFKNGYTIYSEEKRDNFISKLKADFIDGDDEDSILDEFLDLIIDCLLFTPDTNELLPSDSITMPTKQQTCARSCYLHKKHDETQNHTLPGGSVLHRVLSIQKLDELDIEGIYPIYKRLNKKLSASPELRSKSNIEGPFTSDYLAKCDDLDSKLIKDFMLSKTAKDCSIMVAFKPTSNNCDKDTIYTKSGKIFQFSVALIDFDPKPLKRIDKYYNEDFDIVEKFNEFMKTNAIIDDKPI